MWQRPIRISRISSGSWPPYSSCKFSSVNHPQILGLFCGNRPANKRIPWVFSSLYKIQQPCTRFISWESPGKIGLFLHKRVIAILGAYERCHHIWAATHCNIAPFKTEPHSAARRNTHTQGQRSIVTTYAWQERAYIYIRLIYMYESCDMSHTWVMSHVSRIWILKLIYACHMSHIWDRCFWCTWLTWGRFG